MSGGIHLDHRSKINAANYRCHYYFLLFFSLHSIMFIPKTIKILSISIWLFIDIAHHVWNCWKVKNYTTLYGYNNKDAFFLFVNSSVYVLWFWFQFTRELPTTISGMWMKTAASIHHTNENKISLSLLFRCFINFKSGKCILLWMITRYRIPCVYKLHVVIVNDLCFINYFECHANISIFLSAIEFFFWRKKN